MWLTTNRPEPRARNWIFRFDIPTLADSRR
jgi:hypothetical protein